ncbi:similar to KIAA2010 protein (predicted), isoform CRA_a [Rattus norvegicus]|uniref:Similar to KIAA2010 protein (Predicted), isoform CRA_a n=1 Tax=Rattus norvegicus TaxID=10116 RepID=A6JEI5_RAT|nr:similar to KIAA2010 protein (predicted), isoform CRA_a [Rattus norvegicus]
MCIQKQYYFVTKYFILKFASAAVLRFQGNRVEFKTSTVLLNLET